MEPLKKQIATLDVSPLAKQVYLLVITIPKGKVTTYKAIGNALGSRAYRAIGRVLGKNPMIPEIPCHRVVATNRTLNGYAHGLKKKAALLNAEGVKIKDGRVVEACVLRVLG